MYPINHTSGVPAACIRKSCNLWPCRPLATILLWQIWEWGRVKEKSTVEGRGNLEAAICWDTSFKFLDQFLAIKQKKPKRSLWILRCLFPPRNCLLVQFQNLAARAGMILRNDDGEVMFAACRTPKNYISTLKLELAACDEGLKLALNRSGEPLKLEMECASMNTW